MTNNVIIFEDVLYVLRQFSESGKALNLKEIAYRAGISQRSSQRLTKSLKEGGWLDLKRIGCSYLYSATDKTNQLFKADQASTEAQSDSLSMAQIREIVNDAPLGASFYTPNKGYSRMGSVLLDSALSLRDLRKEIADHDAKNMVKFSLNNYVRFKPTPYGLEHYTAKMREFTRNIRSAVDNPTLNVDPEGYAKLQMHEFMNIFGDIAFTGNENFIVGCEITLCLSGA